MRRTRARRLGLHRLTLASALALPRSSRAAPARPVRALSWLAAAAGALARTLGARRRLRIGLLVGIVCVPLAIGGWRWLRTSSLVSVDSVRVTGVHGPEARQVEAALVSAGKRMTTLNVSRSALLAAVAPLHLVRSIGVSTSFPHTMRIHVIEQLPAATLSVAGAQTAVAADGAVLGPSLVSTRLPTISAAYAPSPGALVHDASVRAELEVLGAAPRALVPFLSRAFEGPRGLTVDMRDGLQVFFGNSTRPRAKWLALALVLSDSASAHVSAVDVRTPERPAAEFPAGYAPSTAAATSGEGASASAGRSSESIATALAAGLAASAGYHSSAEAQEANAAKAAEAISPNHQTSESESGSSAPPSGASGSSPSSEGG